MKNLLLKNKLAWWLHIIIIIIIIIIFAVMAYLFVNHQRHATVINATNNLQLLANEKAAQINMFLEFQKENAAALGSLTAFKEAVLYPHDASKVEVASNIANQLEKVMPGIDIVSKEGIVVAGVDPVGTDFSMVPVFPVTESSTVYFSRYYDPIRKGDYYAVGGLIYDDQQKNKVIGVIAFDVELDKISNLMKESLDTKTNEVYLIDGTGLLLSKSEFIGQGGKGGVLIQEVKSDGADKCLADLQEYGTGSSVEAHKEDVFKYLNYMGNEVYGAHAYAPVIGGCVLAEESADEILKFSLMDYLKNIFSSN
jgi:Cache domain